MHETDTGTGGAGRSIVTIKVSLPAANCLLLASFHPETWLSFVILRSGATKNLVVPWSQEILRFAQNDITPFPDGHQLVFKCPLAGEDHGGPSLVTGLDHLKVPL